MHASENPEPDDRLTDPLVAVVTVAPEGAVCDGMECGAPAVVAITLDVWSHPLLRCAECWPPLHDVFQRRGHTISNY